MTVFYFNPLPESKIRQIRSRLNATLRARMKAGWEAESTSQSDAKAKETFRQLISNEKPRKIALPESWWSSRSHFVT